MKTKILVVDDEKDTREMMKDVFVSKGYEVFTAGNGLEALSRIPEAEPDIIISDIRMPKMDGMELLENIRKKFAHIPVIMVTAHGTIETAVEAMKMGAKDYILKPFRLDEILTKIKTFAQLKSLEKENEYLRNKLASKFDFKKIIGKSHKMISLFEMIKDIAPTNTTVLIQGENGTGKELIANAIHYNSHVSNKPFIKLNCGVLAENLLESELFGHVKGAFTGATKDKIGRFEMANGGTLFLDEIGDISPNMQIKLLRVLQEGEFERVGGTNTLHVDVRVIAATNKNLEAEIEKNNFRQDLYYRLNVIPVHVPPLRERKEDIHLLVDYFLNNFNKTYSKMISGIDQDAMIALQDYDWPGNIRELENLLERTVVLHKGDLITKDDFPENISKNTKTVIEYDHEQGLSATLEEYERKLIVRELEKNKGNKFRTAQELKLNRSTFMSRLKKLGIN